MPRLLVFQVTRGGYYGTLCVNITTDNIVPVPRIGENVLTDKGYRKVTDVSYVYHDDRTIVQISTEQ